MGKKVSKSKVSGGVAVWAVDPFDQDAKRIRTAHETVDFFAYYLEWQIRPIAVIGPMDVKWPLALKSSLRESIADVALDSLSPAFEELESDATVLEPSVLVQPTPSLTASVDYLLAAAQKEKAQVVAINTHGRRGLARFRLGSFAETVIASSKIPVLTINPKSKVPKQISTILVPTDFSTTSRRVFVKMLEWARVLNETQNAKRPVKIVLLHHFENPAPALFFGGGEIAVDGALMKQMFDAAEAARRRQAGQWEKLAKGKGVDCETVITTENGDLSSLILERARAFNADLIAMATYRGSIGQGFLGSVARDVLVEAVCPVVIVHR